MEDGRPSSKKFRGTSGPEDRINVSPSLVIHLRQLQPNATEGQILEALQRFGRVAYVVNIQGKRMALVEFEDLASSKRCMEYSNSSPIIIGGSTALVNYSTSQSLNRKGLASEAPNTVLILFIKNVRYPVNVEVIHTICKSHGFVKKIAISQRQEGIQALVEFDSVEAAKVAKYALNGADIYPGCNTIKAEYSKVETINVQSNSDEQWDFTAPKDQFGQPCPIRQEMQKSLLSGPPSSVGGSGGVGMGMGMRSQPMGMGASSGPYGGENGYGGLGQPPYGSPPTVGWGGSAMGGSGSRPMGGVGPEYGGGQGGLMSSPYGEYRPDAGFGPPAAGGGQFGHVAVMLYGTDHDSWTPQRVFNLLCLYGNIGKVKFLKSKPDTVMVEMGSVEQMNQAANCLNGTDVFCGPLTIRRSKQDNIGSPRETFKLPNEIDGFHDFTSDRRNQRFSSPEAAAKNQVMPPTSALHFYNAPADITDDQLITLLTENGADPPTGVTIMKSEKSSRGYINFANEKSATEALIKVNHTSIPSTTGRFPYTFKLAFTRPSRRGTNGE